MHISDLDFVTKLERRRQKLLACFEQFDHMPGSEYRLIADIERHSTADKVWMEMPFIAIRGVQARELCRKQIDEVEAELQRLGVETKERLTP